MRSRQGSGPRGAPGERSQIYVRATGRRRHRGRRLLLALLVLLVVGAAVWLALAEGRAKPVAQPGEVRLVQGKRVVLRRFADELRGSTPRQLSDWLRRIPDRRIGRLGAGRATYQTDRSALAQLARTAIRSGGDDVRVPERAIAFRSQIPIVKQALRNNCETAALSMLLAAKPVRVPQLALQRQLPRARPIDPVAGARGNVWGDPARGFVGRPDGGGPAGGFGVYQGPIRQLAARHKVTVRDLSGRAPGAIYRSLLQGRPVMAWIGLSDGPYRTWWTQAGRRIVGNLGEHAVVLTGLAGDRVGVNDPLTGRRVTWSRAQFELVWRRLDRRALSL